MIGNRRWDRSTPDAAWRESAQTQLPQPATQWNEIANVNVVAADTETKTITFVDPTTPAYFEVVVDVHTLLPRVGAHDRRGALHGRPLHPLQRAAGDLSAPLTCSSSRSRHTYQPIASRKTSVCSPFIRMPPRFWSRTGERPQSRGVVS